MIKPEQVPKDALLSFLDEYNWGNGGEDWARNCVAAAINAWPGAVKAKDDELLYSYRGDVLLPLPQEKNND